MEDTLVPLFYLVDDFCKIFLPRWSKIRLQSGLSKCNREGRMSPSEIMTIYIHFHQSHYRDFKRYYIHYLCQYLSPLFPKLVSYHRFISLIKSILIKVCHIKREKQHKVFKGMAEKAKPTMGWFFGFKVSV